MKVLLLNPPRFHKNLYTLRDEICFQDVKYTPFPLRLAQLASIIEKIEGIEVGALDANALRLSWKDLEERDLHCDVCIFQSAPGLIAHDAGLAGIVKEQNADAKVIIIESVVAPIFPERFLKDFNKIDYCILGSPETIIPVLLKNIRMPEQVKGIAFRKSREIFVTESADALFDMDALPFMGYRYFPMKEYSIGYLDAPFHERLIPGIRIRTTRDCPYHCPFCIIGSSIHRGYTGKWRSMSAERAVSEIEYVAKKLGIRGFFFWDETFTLDKERAYAVCEKIIKRKLDITWRCLTRIDRVDEELLRMMRRAGCRMIEYGIETGEEATRRGLHKNFSDSQILDVVKLTRKAGIRANCDLIVGLPHDSLESVARSVALARKMDADNIHLTMAFPYPATDFYKTAEEEGLLEVDDIYELMVHRRVRVGATSFVKTRFLSKNELEAVWRKARKEINDFYFRKRVLKRPWDMISVFSSCKSPSDFIRLLAKGMKFLEANLFKTRESP